MEPNKLEDQIREKLNAREIKPSAQSWDRLDAMLSVAENKKPKRSFRWLFIAASIVGFVFAGLFFFNQDNENTEIPSNQAVVENNSDAANPEKEKLPSATFSQSNQSVKKEVEVKNTAIASLSESKKETVKTKREPVNQQFAKYEIVAKENSAEAVPKKMEEKPKEAINPSALLASNEPGKSEKEIQHKPKIKIDANALLSQVDGEIELTFRQKTIKTISKNFESAREAVASRNQQ